MGATLRTFFAALGQALQQIWMFLFGGTIRRVEAASDRVLSDLHGDFNALKHVVDGIPGVNRVTGLGTAMGNMADAVQATQNLTNSWLTAASNAGLIMFSWMLVVGVGLGAAGIAAYE